jgi:RNA polymerase-binding transcription factor DksA
MSENRTIHLVEVPIGGKGGFVWNRLHGEREDICEALVKDSVSDGRRELLQSRLRKVDDALDRLMAGSYGNCSKCGRSIEDTKLDVDPALALCLGCWGRQPDLVISGEDKHQKLDGASSDDVVMENLKPFDTVVLRTHNSEYRILLLDPKTGRALVEGGNYLDEPREALLKGSAAPGSSFNTGSICIGCRLEMWIDERVFITSPIRSIEVTHNAAAESLQSISEALH